MTIKADLELQSALPEDQLSAEDASQGAPVKALVAGGTTIEPYDGRVTLDLREWTMAASNLREFLHKIQMNIRDVDSKNYEEMRECEIATKVSLFDIVNDSVLKFINVEQIGELVVIVSK